MLFPVPIFYVFVRPHLRICTNFFRNRLWGGVVCRVTLTLEVEQKPMLVLQGGFTPLYHKQQSSVQVTCTKGNRDVALLL